MDFEVGPGVSLIFWWGGVPTRIMGVSGAGNIDVGRWYGGISTTESQNVSNGKILVTTTGYTAGTIQFSATLHLVKQVFTVNPDEPECFLLTEDGGFLLQESGFKIGLETCATPTTVTITTVKWWLGLTSLDGPTITSFQLRIWADTAGAPPANYVGGSQLYTQDIPIASAALHFDSTPTSLNIYDCTATLTTPFVATIGTKYWISIVTRIPVATTQSYWASSTAAGSSYSEFFTTPAVVAFNLAMTLSDAGGAVFTLAPDLTAGNTNGGTLSQDDAAVNAPAGYPFAIGYATFTL